jgi:hypothetical protein
LNKPAGPGEAWSASVIAFGHGQESVRGAAMQPFFWFALGQGLHGERGRGVGVAVELGEIAAMQRGRGP